MGDSAKRSIFNRKKNSLWMGLEPTTSRIYLGRANHLRHHNRDGSVRVFNTIGLQGSLRNAVLYHAHTLALHLKTQKNNVCAAAPGKQDPIARLKDNAYPEISYTRQL